jgi:ABC-type dipeptide/oligopeptide/nickel transport system permease subunit
MVERNKEYVQAARVIGISAPMIMLRHVLPNVMGPVLVIAEGVEEVVVWTSWSVRCF